MGVADEPTQMHEYGKASPASELLGSSVGEGDIPSSPASSLAVYGRQKTGTPVHEMLELVMSLTSCNTQENGPCTLPV